MRGEGRATDEKEKWREEKKEKGEVKRGRWRKRGDGRIRGGGERRRKKKKWKKKRNKGDEEETEELKREAVTRMEID